MERSTSYKSTQRTRKGAVTSFGSRTDIGCIREQNEDSLVVKPPLYVVADGMGGHAAGEVASEIAVTTIAECAPEHADAEELGRAVEQANRDIINAALAGEGREGMGTTCTAAMLEGNRLVIAQVGDSRAYLLQSGKLTQITRDHSLMANMIEAGQITPEEARVHPNRSVITRALGNDPDTIPDLYEINVEDGDRLLLCSDGLSSMIEDDELQAVMNRIADPQRCASTLVNGAIAAGGLDNITVIVVNVEGAGGKKLRRTTIRTRITVAFVLLLFVAIIAGTAWGGYTYLHNSAYLAANDQGMVTVYRGAPGSALGFTYSELIEETTIPVSKLSPSAQERINEGMPVENIDEAYRLISDYRKQLREEESSGATATSSQDAQQANSAAASTTSTNTSGALETEDVDASSSTSGAETQTATEGATASDGGAV